MNICRRSLRCRMLTLPVVLVIARGAAQAAVFTVTSGFDSGPGSLREAVALAAAAAGADTVNFAPGSFPGGGTVNLAANLTIPAAGDTAGLTLSTAVAGGGNVEVAVNAGTLSFGAGSVWTGGGRILLGGAGGSDAMVDLAGADGGVTLGANIVVRGGSGGMRTLRASNKNGYNFYHGKITLEAPLTAEMLFSSGSPVSNGAVEFTGDINLGPHLLSVKPYGYASRPMEFTGRIYRDDPGTDPARMKVVPPPSIPYTPAGLAIGGAGDNTRLTLEALAIGEKLYLSKGTSPTVHALGGGLPPGTVVLSSSMVGVSSGGDQIADGASVAWGGGTAPWQSHPTSPWLWATGEETVDAMNGGGSLVGGPVTAGAAGGSGNSSLQTYDRVSGFSGQLSLRKIGSGIQTLSGRSWERYGPLGEGGGIYGGFATLAVSGGILNLTGDYALGKATVESGGTLTGAGTVGSVILRNGGFLAPGGLMSPNNLSVLKLAPALYWPAADSTLTWDGGGTARFRLGSQGLSDGVTMTGTLLKGSAGPCMVDFQGTGTAGLTYTLATFAGTALTAADFSYTNLAPSLTGSFAVNAGSLTFTTVGVFFPMVTSTAGSGPGSLRQCLTDAAAHPGPDTVVFAPSLDNQVIVAGSEIVISDSAPVTIDASGLPGGVTVDGGPGTNRIFTLAFNQNLTLRGLTLSGGGGTGTTGSGAGGAILVNDNGILTAERCTFTGNGASDGGAICVSNNNGSPVTLTQCTLSGNGAGTGGALSLHCGGTLSHCTLSKNTANGGGGIYNAYGSTLTLNNCIVAGNTAFDQGGDVLNFSGTVIRTGANLLQSLANTGGPPGTDSGPAAIGGPPLLAPLDNYGGPVKTMALLPVNPARHAAVGSAVTGDQRGFPLVGPADIGAYEAGTTGPNFNAFVWETLPAGATAAQHAAAFDFDSDGLTNFDEWLALTDPGYEGSVFRPLASSGGGGHVISFPTVEGRIYRLRQSDNLTNWSDAPAAPLSGNGAVQAFLPPVDEARRFYQVVPALP